jgi:hypothetical protein
MKAKAKEDCIITTPCLCGVELKLSNMQFREFDCGMMGILNCPECKAVLFPSEYRGKVFDCERNDCECMRCKGKVCKIMKKERDEARSMLKTANEDIVRLNKQGF